MTAEADRLRRLEARLEELEAREAIRALKARYAELVDARYGAQGPLQGEALEALAGRIAELFCEDGVWEGGSLGTCTGRAAIRARMADPTLAASWHYFVQPQLEVEGDRARGRWDLLAPCTTPDGRPHWMAGVEHDEYRRVDGLWLHSRMRLEVAFFAPHEHGWGSRSRS